MTTGCIIPFVVFATSMAAVIYFVRLYFKSQAQEATKRLATAEQHARDLKEAEVNYRNSLEALRALPTDPDLRSETLSWGRRLAGLMRHSGAVTTFDEVALSNDISAACAAASQPVTESGAPAPGPAPSIEARLAKLKSLLDNGTINEDEYREKRSRLLDEV